MAITWNWPNFIVGVSVFLLTFFGTIALAAFILVRLPADYFDPRVSRSFMQDWPWPVRWSGLLLKNLLGIVVIALGVVLSVPGMPGQGFLMIMLGFMLMDVPGKRAIIRRIARVPRITAAINALRARYAKAPIIVD